VALNDLQSGDVEQEKIMKSSKRWTSLALTLAIAGGALPGAFTPSGAPLGLTAAHAQAGGITVLLNGRLLNLGVTGATQVGGRVMVPLRGVFEALGASVDYDPATMTVFATRADTQMQLRLGSTQANVNGQVRTLDVPAQSRFGRTLVPLRFVSEALGASVNWNDAQRTVYIVAPENPVVLPGENPLPAPVPAPVPAPAPAPEPAPAPQVEKISGVVFGAVVSTRTFVLHTDDDDEITVRVDGALPRNLSTYDRVTVSGTRNGDNFDADTLTIDADVRPIRGTGEVTKVTRRQITVETPEGRVYTIIPNANSAAVQVGDNVRFNGYIDGANVRYADVTIRDGNANDAGNTVPDRNNDGIPDNPPPATTGVTVDFSGTVESVNVAARTFTVRGDNGQLYTVAYRRINQVARDQRVRVQGTYADGVTTATTVTVRN